jgi:hypothetical protein
MADLPELSNDDTEDHNKAASATGSGKPPLALPEERGIAPNRTEFALGEGEVAGRDETVTVENPTPPTNIPSGGMTPPTPFEQEPVEQDTKDPATWEDPKLFAAPTFGEAHEGAGTEVVEEIKNSDDEVIGYAVSTCEPYTTEPNVTDPSSQTPGEPEQPPA